MKILTDMRLATTEIHLDEFPKFAKLYLTKMLSVIYGYKGIQETFQTRDHIWHFGQVNLGNSPRFVFVLSSLISIKIFNWYLSFILVFVSPRD